MAKARIIEQVFYAGPTPCAVTVEVREEFAYLAEVREVTREEFAYLAEVIASSVKGWNETTEAERKPTESGE